MRKIMQGETTCAALEKSRRLWALLSRKEVEGSPQRRAGRELEPQGSPTEDPSLQRPWRKVGFLCALLSAMPSSVRLPAHSLHWNEKSEA